MSPFNAQQAIDDNLGNLHSWNATLHFLVERFPKSVDIFQFTDPIHRVTTGHTYPVKFDSIKYPPTSTGLDLLKV
jgi:hypothetical protein